MLTTVSDVAKLRLFAVVASTELIDLPRVTWWWCVVQVRENSDVGTFVAHLSVVDADSGDNGRFVCSVDNRNFALQQIYTSELKLVTSSRLDRERRDDYQLSISCRDFGVTPLTSVVALNVKVRHAVRTSSYVRSKSVARTIYLHLARLTQSTTFAACIISSSVNIHLTPTYDTRLY